MLAKIPDMSKIINKVYKLGLHNLQTGTLSFPDQEKLLQKVYDG